MSKGNRGSALWRAVQSGLDVYGQSNGVRQDAAYFIRDGRGDVRIITDTGGNLWQLFGDQAVYYYTATGGNIDLDPDYSVTTHLLSDGVYDSVTGFEYQNARWRNGSVFTQRDAQGYGNNQDPLSLHLYLYADGNPINGNDPTGHDDNNYIGGAEAEGVVYGEESLSVGDNALAIAVGDNAPSAIIQAQTVVSSTILPLAYQDPIVKFAFAGLGSIFAMGAASVGVFAASEQLLEWYPVLYGSLAFTIGTPLAMVAAGVGAVFATYYLYEHFFPDDGKPDFQRQSTAPYQGY